MPKNLSGGSSVNNIKPSFSHKRNLFNFNAHELLTAPFGYAVPFHVHDCISDETVPLSTSHEIQTYTLKSPMMSDFRLIKSFYQVPMDAILPRTWSYIFTNPTQGDDVPDDALCQTLKINELMQNLYNCGANIYPNASNYYDRKQFLDYQGFTVNRINSMILLESILSYGGLTQYLRGNLLRFVESVTIDGVNHTDRRTIGLYVEKFFQNFNDFLIYTYLAGGIDYVSNVMCGEDSVYKVRYNDNLSEARHIISLLRENPYLWLSFDEGSAPLVNLGSEFDDFFGTYTEDPEYGFDFTMKNGITFYDFAVINESFNYSRLLAYQISCAEFMTNQFVDSVYTAQLYRDNCQSLADSVVPNHLNWYFSYNGVSVMYDAFSGHIFDKLVDFITDAGESDASVACALSYFANIFVFKRSLKRVDYFTSLKTRPLAVGNTTAEVVGSSVNAVDMTRAIQIQRFLNSVNRFGRRFSDYVRGIFGGDVPYDRHEPHFLLSQSFSVRGFEVENTTSEDLGNRVTVLKSSDSKFAYEVNIEIPSIVIGILHFELARAYGDSNDRHFYHADRFDMFNPFLQYIGDQSCLKTQIIPVQPEKAPFGYESRYHEYKESYDHASGGFCLDGSLSSWAPVLSSGVDVIGNYSENQDSDFIRSFPVDLDRFYASLTGNTLATYFHFILSIYNNVEDVKPVEHRPNIL